MTQPHGDGQPEGAEPAWKYADILSALKTATDRDQLDEAASFIGALPNQIHRDQLNALYEERAASMQ